MNDVSSIAISNGGEAFKFDYAHADVADTFVLQSGNWGQYNKLGAEVGSAITPGVDSDGTSVPSGATFSIPLFHLPTYSSAHIRWDGTGATLSYTLDGTTWITLSEASAVALNPATNPDLDIRVSFAGGVQDDPAVINSITVYVMRTDTLVPMRGNRVATFTADALTDDGIKMTDGGLVVSADISPAPTTFQSVEFWTRFDASSADNLSVFDSSVSNAWLGFVGNVLEAGTAVSVFVDGAALSATASKYLDGNFHHIIVSLAAPTNTQFGVAHSFTTSLPVPMTVKELASYPQLLTLADAQRIYTSGVGPEPIRIDDPGTITVTEPDASVRIYAYPWQNISNSRK